MSERPVIRILRPWRYTGTSYECRVQHSSTVTTNVIILFAHDTANDNNRLTGCYALKRTLLSWISERTRKTRFLTRFVRTSNGRKRSYRQETTRSPQLLNKTARVNTLFSRSIHVCYTHIRHILGVMRNDVSYLWSRVVHLCCNAVSTTPCAFYYLPNHFCGIYTCWRRWTRPALHPPCTCNRLTRQFPNKKKKKVRRKLIGFT